MRKNGKQKMCLALVWIFNISKQLDSMKTILLVLAWDIDHMLKKMRKESFKNNAKSSYLESFKNNAKSSCLESLSSHFSVFIFTQLYGVFSYDWNYLLIELFAANSDQVFFWRNWGTPPRLIEWVNLRIQWLNSQLLHQVN